MSLREEIQNYFAGQETIKIEIAKEWSDKIIKIFEKKIDELWQQREKRVGDYDLSAFSRGYFQALSDLKELLK